MYVQAHLVQQQCFLLLSLVYYHVLIRHLFVGYALLCLQLVHCISF